MCKRQRNGFYHFFAPTPMSKRQRNGGFYQHVSAHRSTVISVSQDARRVNIHSKPVPSVCSLPTEQRIYDHDSESTNERNHWADIGGLESLLNGQELKDLQADEEDNVADITVVKPIRKSVCHRLRQSGSRLTHPSDF